MRQIEKTEFYSYKIGELAEGCKLCVKGEKTVLFATGLCGQHCYYCPISDEKKDKDVIFANEWKISNEQEIIKEIENCSSLGVGITGGDPLVKIERVVEYIKLLKNKFGKKFHIHLYTPLQLVNKENLEKLYKAGLDEIRFHPDFLDFHEEGKIKLALSFDWDVGCEIPVIPGKESEIKDFIDKINILGVKFLNLNELEVSDTNSSKLIEKGFETKEDYSYGVKGSEELALKLLDYCAKNTKLNIHYCTATLKDKVQLANRIKKRAKNVAKKYDIITEEGSLIRGAIYLKELVPSFNYRKKLESLENKKEVLYSLTQLKEKLIENLKINSNLIEVDEHKLRLLTSRIIVKTLAKRLKDLNLVPAIVEEYPTWDEFEIEINFL